MSSPAPSAMELSRLIKERAAELGFSLAGIAPASRPETFEAFQAWLRQGLHAEMDYLPRREAAYAHPQGVLPSVRSIVVVAMSYGPGEFPADSRGRIAAYAQGTCDYHDLLRAKLQDLAAVIHTARPGSRTRGVVDTAPLLERDVARRAGLGWFGKNTMLLNKRIGSCFFLAGLLTDCELSADEPHEASHCGTCTRCIDACPTSAFTSPYVLDAGRCISYLTIELREAAVPAELRTGVGDWLFGCDVCQQVCPWNRKSPLPDDPALAPRPEATQAAEFLLLTEEEFQAKYGATPLSRPGRSGMARNAAIVLGNTGTSADLPALQRGLLDPSPWVRGAVAWALGRIGGPEAKKLLVNAELPEENSGVLDEIRAAIASFPEVERDSGSAPLVNGSPSSF